MVANINTSGIYKITNVINNKCYIGSARIIKYRIKEHFRMLDKDSHHSKKLQNAYNKYGKENFVFDVLINCPIEYLVKSEQWFIDTLSPDYNIAKVAGSSLVQKRTQEQKDKIKNNHARHNLGKKFSDEVRKKMSEAQKKRLPPSKETIEKRKKKLKGRGLSEAHKQSIRIALTGKKLSTESIKKRSESITKNRRKVAQYDMNMNIIHIWKHRDDAVDNSGIPERQIQDSLVGRVKKKHLFIFKYIENVK